MFDHYHVGDEIMYGGSRYWVVCFATSGDVSYMIVRSHHCGSDTLIASYDEEGIGMLDGPFQPSGQTMPEPGTEAIRVVRACAD